MAKFKNLFIVYWTLALVFLLQVMSGLCSQEEERLVRDLFRGYNKLIRPVQNMTEKVAVSFGLAFIQLINVNEKNQIMKSNVWLRLVWNDYQLQWDEADYGGISVLRLPPDKVWKPDIVLFNNADGNYEVRYKSNVLIYPDGEVLWVPPAIYQVLGKPHIQHYCTSQMKRAKISVPIILSNLLELSNWLLAGPNSLERKLGLIYELSFHCSNAGSESSCTIDVTYFPFDQQTCIMKFGSWTFTGDQVSLNLYNNKDYVDLSDYWKSGTWDIIEVPAYLNVHNDSTDSDNRMPTETDITFYITIRRKTLFYTVNLILPTVLISFLCVLVFYLPAEAGEKVTLGISILLSLVVFLLLVSKILPPTSLVLPLIAKYLLFTFIMNTVSILVTVVIINWNFRGPRTHSMPNWIRTLFLKYLPIFLFMRRPKKTRLRWMMEIPGTSRKVPQGPPPNVMTSSGGMLPGGIPDGGIHGISPPGYGQDFQGPDKPLPPVPGGGMPGGTPPPPPVPGGHNHMRAGSMNDLDRKNAIEVMELSDMHHPSCKLSQSRQGSFDDEADDVDDRSPLHDMSTHSHHSHHSHHSCHSYNNAAAGHPAHPPPMPVGGTRRDSDLSDAFLSPEAYRATQAVEFIAEHLRNEDEYVQIREDWKFVAMVVDRLQLYVFFMVTTVGTIGILMDAPHIFEYVDQDKIIDIYRGK